MLLPSFFAFLMTRRYEPLQTRKAVMGTAAPGALVETTDGSMLVLPVEQWPYYENQNRLKAPENQILDARFCQYLQRLYPDLKRLVRVPVNDIKHNFSLKPGQPDDVMLGRWFPEWAYCPATRKFQHMAQWQTAWTAAGPTARGNPRTLDTFNPPATVVSSTKVGGQPTKYQQRLEQVRFVLVAANGEVADVPWAHWLLARRDGRVPVQEANGRTQAIVLDFSKPLPPHDFLNYTVFDGGGDLSGIQLTATLGGQPLRNAATGKPWRTSLNGLYSLRVSRRDLVEQGLLFGQKGRGKARTGDENILFRPVVRTSNSIYYPNTLDSLFIPTPIAQQNFDVLDAIRAGHQQGDNAARIVYDVERFTKIKLDEQYVQSLIDAKFRFTKEVAALSEQVYREAEFTFITSSEAREYRNAQTRLPELNFSKVSDLQVPGVQAVFRLDQLKVVSVQPSYTRLEPQAAEQALAEDGYSMPLRAYPTDTREGSQPQRHFIVEKGTRTDFLPAYESYGEGIFFQFDSVALTTWATQHAANLNPRLAGLQANYNRLPRAAREPRILTLAEVLVHTTSHLLMKELEFQCGYPVPSLKERLYASTDGQHHGLLLYTVAGAEGSYGGLVGLCDEGGERLQSVIKNALLRAQDCASDPICWDTPVQQGQGVGGQNLAACASCVLVPETSCECFNCFLDRQLVVDTNFGFFAKYLF